MKLSIFPKAKALPSSKDEKEYNAKFASNPHVPETVEVDTDDDLIRLVSSYAWSNSIFKGVRRQDNFVSCDFLVLDIDEGMKIEEAEKICEEARMTTLCLPSTSHTPENHRYRLIFPLSKTITDPATFIASMKDLVENFPSADPHCVTNYCCFYYASKTEDGFWIEGDLLEPVEPPKTALNSPTRRLDVSAKVRTSEDIKELIKDLYGEEREVIPEAVDFFIKNAPNGIPNSWICSLNDFSFVLSLQGVDLDTIKDLVAYLSPMPQSPRELATIERAVKDGIEAAKVESENK